MSAAHHTAGPWRVEALTNAYFDIEQVVQHGYGRRVATTHTAADASLIAAAPDLLKAARFAVMALANITESSPHDKAFYGPAYRALDEAIAKATGAAA